MHTLVADIGVFGKRSYHAKDVPSLLQDTVLARNGIYRKVQFLHVMASTVACSRKGTFLAW